MENIDIKDFKKRLLDDLKFDESVLSKDGGSIYYTLDDVKQWIQFGLDNDYINVMKSDGIKDWISMLNDKNIIFKNNSNGKQFSRQKSSS